MWRRGKDGENSCFSTHGHILNDCEGPGIIVVTQEEYTVKRTQDRNLGNLNIKDGGRGHEII